METGPNGQIDLDVIIENEGYGHTNEMTPLLAATKGGHEGIVEILLRKGADVDARCGFEDFVGNVYGETSLIIASELGFEEIVETLLRYGANHSVYDGYGLSALARAAGNGMHSIARLLLRKVPDITESCLTTALALTVKSDLGNIETVELLLNAGANVNVRVTDGLGNPLIYAVQSRRPDIVKLLVKYGADPALENEAGQSAIWYACALGEVKTAEFLFKSCKGFRSYHNCLKIAAKRGHPNVVAMLLNNGVELCEEDFKCQEINTLITQRAKERCQKFTEELMAVVYHPTYKTFAYEELDGDMSFVAPLKSVVNALRKNFSTDDGFSQQ